jgi:hypothetical protein
MELPQLMSDTPSIHPDVRIGHVHLKVAGSRACILLWRSRFPIDATLRPSRRFHFGGRVSSPHRAQHVGKSRRLSASARQHGTLSPGDSLSDARRACRRPASPGACEHFARRRVRPRGERSALSARSRRQRRRTLLGSPARKVAAGGRWRTGNVHAPARSRQFAR